MNRIVAHWQTIEPYSTTQRTFGAIDHILDDVTSSEDSVVVRGWFFDLKGKVSTVEITANGYHAGACVYGTARVDVAEAFPSFDRSLKSGFLASFPRATLLAAVTIDVRYAVPTPESFAFSLKIPPVNSEGFKVRTAAPVALIDLESLNPAAVELLPRWIQTHHPGTILIPPLQANTLPVLPPDIDVRPFNSSQASRFVRLGTAAHAPLLAFGPCKSGWIIDTVQGIGLTPRTTPIVWYHDSLETSATYKHPNFGAHRAPNLVRLRGL